MSDLARKEYYANMSRWHKSHFIRTLYNPVNDMYVVTYGIDGMIYEYDINGYVWDAAKADKSISEEMRVSIMQNVLRQHNNRHNEKYAKGKYSTEEMIPVEDLFYPEDKEQEQS